MQAAFADRYTIERELGRGGMATVYLAQDLKHHRAVAIKVLKPELATALGPGRFLREIETTAHLNHPHILTLHDSGDAAGFVYYVMPFVEGETLRHRLDRVRQLSIDEALKVAREVADALGYAHSHDVVHRDIKPDNILLASEHAVVSDFGIARAIRVAGGDKLTATGIAVGTPTYMSPEQAAGDKEIDGRSDLYSLGCVLYEMLAGEPPFSGLTAQAVMARHALDPMPPLRTVRQSVSENIERIVRKLLEKVPADRFRSAAEVSIALESGGELGFEREPVRKTEPVRPVALASFGPTWRKPRDDEIDVYGLSQPGTLNQANRDYFLILSLQKQLKTVLTNVSPIDQQKLQEDNRVAFLTMVADASGTVQDSGKESSDFPEVIRDYLTGAISCCYSTDGSDAQAFARALEEAALRRHLELLRRDPTGRGAAIALTMWIGVWPRVFIVQIGNSRYYVLREGQLTQLTRDQANPLKETGVLGSAFFKTDASATGLATPLLSALGGLQMAPVVMWADSNPGAVHMLCTDGLTNRVPYERIRDRLRSMTSAKQVCSDLLQDALDAGSGDDVTIVIGRVAPKDANQGGLT